MTTTTSRPAAIQVSAALTVATAFVPLTERTLPLDAVDAWSARVGGFAVAALLLLVARGLLGYARWSWFAAAAFYGLALAWATAGVVANPGAILLWVLIATSAVVLACLLAPSTRHATFG